MSNQQLATAAQPQRVSALSVMANRLNIDPARLHETLQASVFAKASKEEFMALVIVANEYQLNPLTKEIYAFPAKGGGIVPVVSIDGWVSMTNNHPAMDGVDFEYHHDEAGGLVAVTGAIYRKDRSRPIRVTEYLSECKRATEPWKMENRMLRHKAFMQCARYAFGFSGVTDDDEAADTPGMRNVTPANEQAPAPTLKPVHPLDQPEPSAAPAQVATDDLM